MLHTAASDLGLCCLSMSHRKDARLIWVKWHEIHLVFRTAIMTAADDKFCEKYIEFLEK